MRIGIDAHYLGARVMGRETYLGNLVRHLVRFDRDNHYILYVWASKVAEGLGEVWDGRVEFRVIRPRSTLLQRTVLLPVVLRQDRIDVFYLHTLGVPFFSGKTVLAIHGIRELRFAPPGTRFLLRALLPWSLQSAFRIIANSEYTRGELVAGYGVPPERIRVVHGGVDQTVFNPCGDAAEGTATIHGYAPDRPSCIYLGAIEERKNLIRLMEAVAIASPRLVRPLSVIIAGVPRGREGRRYLTHLLSVVRGLGLTDAVRFVGYVDPPSAARLLRRASFLVFPSLHESFGLPPLEALACGTPVLAARVGSLPEVLGDAALWCDPRDVPSIAEGIYRLTTEESLRAFLVKRGQERAASFTWEAAAIRTLEVFREAADATPPGAQPGHRSGP